MKQSKRLLAMLLTLVMVVCMLPMTVFAADTELDYEAVVNSAKEKAAAGNELFADAGLSGIDKQGVGDNKMDETENNNSMSTADIIKNDYTVNGSVSKYDLMDYYKFTITSAKEITLLVMATRSTLVCGIWDSSDNLVAAYDDLYYEDGYYWYTLNYPLTAGTYYLIFFPDANYLQSISYAYYIKMDNITTYTIKYDANGGTGAPGNGTKFYGWNGPLSSKIPTRDGYKFVNWNTKKDGTGTSYAPGERYYKDANVTLYAQWKKLEKYTITYDANGGTGGPTKQTKTEDKTLTLSTKKPTRTGYDFVEWNTKKDGSGTSYASGAEYTANKKATLYAQWKKKTYTIQYNANGGSGAPSSQTKTYGKTLTLDTIKPTRSGYVFDSWNTAADGTGTAYGSGGSYKENKAATLYAQWIADYVTRISGKNRSLTAIAAADVLKQELYVSSFDTIILASGTNFADALAGSYLAAVKSAPILLHTSSTIDQNLEYITANLSNGGMVYILGGNGAVSADVETALREQGLDVKRLSGKDRFATNIAILEEAGVTADQEILICTGYNFADSLSASATGLPILLVNSNKDKLTDAQIAYLEKLTAVEESAEPGEGEEPAEPGEGEEPAEPGEGEEPADPGEGDEPVADPKKELNLTIIGGTGAVSDNLKGMLEEYGTVGRLSGKDRYATSVAIAEAYFEEPDTVLIAYGKNFPDGLCGGPLAYAMGAPLLLVQSGKEAAAADYVEVHSWDIYRAYVLGGTGAVSTQSVQKIFG